MIIIIIIIIQFRGQILFPFVEKAHKDPKFVHRVIGERCLAASIRCLKNIKKVCERKEMILRKTSRT